MKAPMTGVLVAALCAPLCSCVWTGDSFTDSLSPDQDSTATTAVAPSATTFGAATAASPLAASPAATTASPLAASPAASMAVKTSNYEARAGWNFGFGQVPYTTSRGQATFKPVSAFCTTPTTFFAGNDMTARHMILGAYYANKPTNVNIIVGGTKDGRDIENMFSMTWYDASKTTLVGTEASGPVAHFAEQRTSGHTEVTIDHLALSDQDNQSFTNVAGPGNLSDLTSLGRQASTKTLETLLIEKFSATGGTPVADYTMIDVEGVEPRVILGMGVQTNTTTALSIRQKFPVFQFELGSNWLNFGRVDASQNRDNYNQQRIIEHLESLGYATFLMGQDAGLPILLRAHAEFSHQAKCVANPDGQGFFLPGNALAVSPDSPTYILDAIDLMVTRGQVFVDTQYGAAR